MKGIILAGGSGTRLRPTTKAVSKHLLPVYDKPCIYYPLSTLMLAEIKDVLIIVNRDDIQAYNLILGDGSDLGMNINYEIQMAPNGIAEALLLGEEFLAGEDFVLILGDNIFYGDELGSLLLKNKKIEKMGHLFSYHVADPERFGVVTLDNHGAILSIDEKPKNPNSNLAITGLYYYKNAVISIAKELKPSARGELEITDINKILLENSALTMEEMGRGIAWLDIGNPDALLEASQLIGTIQKRQGRGICCIEEIAFKNGWIQREQLMKLIDTSPDCTYTYYLKKVLK